MFSLFLGMFWLCSLHQPRNTSTTTSYSTLYHTCHKLCTKISEIRQNFKGDLTKFCEIFLNITLELPQYSLKSSFFHVRSLWKPWLCVIYVYFFIKSVIKWSENSEIRIFYGNCLPDGPHSVRFYLTVWDTACMLMLAWARSAHGELLCQSMSVYVRRAMAAILKICFSLLLLNPKANWLQRW